MLLYEALQRSKQFTDANHKRHKMRFLKRQPLDNFSKYERAFLVNYPPHKENQSRFRIKFKLLADGFRVITFAVPFLGIDICMADPDALRISPTLYHPILQVSGASDIQVKLATCTH